MRLASDAQGGSSLSWEPMGVIVSAQSVNANAAAIKLQQNNVTVQAIFESGGSTTVGALSADDGRLKYGLVVGQTYTITIA